MKKNVPLLICVQSKNNLPSLSTAHWGRLVKESVSKERKRERESQSAAEDQTKRREKRDKKKREGLRWKMEHKWEGRGRVRAKKAKEEECWERCGTDESSRANEFMKLQRLLSGSDSYVVNCSLSPRQSASRPQCNAITHLFGPTAFVSLGAAIKAPSAWKCGITDEVLRGPVAWPLSESRSPHKQ